MCETKPAEELYDGEADPDNVRNLAGDPAHQDCLEKMRTALNTFLTRIGDLGERSEMVLIGEGLVADCLDEYRARIVPLPGKLRLGPELTVLEMPDGDPPQ
jgi:hypothetical protein